jgi:4-diphosphocytidyl-2-C-methyl-D-erythritol kinase
MPIAPSPSDRNLSAPLACVAVCEAARAKVNLTLGVKGRRADGFHELQSLAAFAGLADDLSFYPGEEGGLLMDGPFAQKVEGANLVKKAAAAMRGWFSLPLKGRFRLTKRIPVAAGLGGGSADAAAAIRALTRAYDLPLASLTDWPACVAQIGADVPVCLAQKAAWMEGRGERIAPLRRLPPLPAVLVNPGVMLSTREVFRELGAPLLAARRGSDAEPPLPQAFSDFSEAISFVSAGRNSLEAPASRLAPVIHEALGSLRALEDCAVARLSGSGPTCFGLFPSAEAAQGAADRLARSHPGWWIAATTLR